MKKNRALLTIALTLLIIGLLLSILSIEYGPLIFALSIIILLIPVFNRLKPMISLIRSDEFMDKMEVKFKRFRKSMQPRIQELKFSFRKIRENHLSLVGLSIILGFAFIAISAPIIAPPQNPDDPYMIPRDGFSTTPQPPSDEHIFGTTQGQYDIYYGVIWGTRTAFRIGIIVVGATIAIGTLLGSIAGYFGGILDETIMRLVDIVIAFPAIILAIVIVTLFGANLDIVMMALIAAWWPYPARLVRGEILSVREEDYVDAARAVGSSDFRIISKHVLPNSIYPVLVMGALDMGGMVIVAAALSFLGLGAPVGYADWGGLLNLARNWIVGPPGAPLKFWFVHIIPGLFIFLYVLGWMLLGDAFRDIMDPRLRRR